MSFLPDAGICWATACCTTAGGGVFVGGGVAVEVGVVVLVGSGVGSEVAGGKGVDDGVAGDVEVAEGSAVSLGFAIPVGNKDRIWLSWREPRSPRMAADTDVTAAGQKPPTAIKLTTRTTSSSGMKIRLAVGILGEIFNAGRLPWLGGAIRAGCPGCTKVDVGIHLTGWLF